ncbi:hypothetical protein L2E82_09221 [Cichorium intybus]|uniref:Uncharacterized protein n=1 Tax=Cichorium intybus TaxID=13427 RepID=A0ACB9G8V6_CICIN|nr:hypothetical protein L2E82_09221 [Cichorium intybus]
MANRRLFAKRARFSRQHEDCNKGRSQGKTQNIGYERGSQGRITENGWRRENVSYVEVVKGSGQSSLPKNEVEEEGKSSKPKEKYTQEEKVKIIEVETEEDLIHKRREFGEEEGEEFSESSEGEDLIESSDDDSPAGLSDEDFEDTLDDSIIRESSPEEENSDVRHAEIIQKLNGKFMKLTDILHEKENLNEFDNVSQINGGKLGGQIEKESSPSPIKTTPLVDGNKNVEMDLNTQRINSPIQDCGSFIKNTDAQNAEDINTPGNKKDENEVDGGDKEKDQGLGA